MELIRPQSTVKADGNGRIYLPSKLRKRLCIGTDEELEILLDEDSRAVILKPTKERGEDE